jgi:fructuronate reductase
MDNCSHNGEKLRNSVLTVARQWQAGGFVDGGFVDWMTNEIGSPSPGR